MSTRAVAAHHAHVFCPTLQQRMAGILALLLAVDASSLRLTTLSPTQEIRCPERKDSYMANTTLHSPLSPYLDNVIVEAPNTIYKATGDVAPDMLSRCTDSALCWLAKAGSSKRVDLLRQTGVFHRPTATVMQSSSGSDNGNSSSGYHIFEV